MQMVETDAEAVRRAKLSVDPLSVEMVREKVFAGLAPVPVFAEAINRQPRMVSKYIVAGMPTTWIGKTPYVVVEPAIEWLRTRRQRSQEARPRGRPRKDRS